MSGLWLPGSLGAIRRAWLRFGLGSAWTRFEPAPLRVCSASAWLGFVSVWLGFGPAQLRFAPAPLRPTSAPLGGPQSELGLRPPDRGGTNPNLDCTPGPWGYQSEFGLVPPDLGDTSPNLDWCPPDLGDTCPILDWCPQTLEHLDYYIIVHQCTANTTL